MISPYAPDIQERVLEVEAIDGRKPLTERGLREVVRHEGWGGQREAWARLRLSTSVVA